MFFLDELANEPGATRRAFVFHDIAGQDVKRMLIFACFPMLFFEKAYGGNDREWCSKVFETLIK